MLKSLKTIDEVIVPARAGSEDSFGAAPYIPYQRFEELRTELADNESIDGLAPMVSESVPAVNLTTKLSEGRVNVVGLDPAFLSGFDGFKLHSGEEVVLENLALGEAYVNDEAAKELEALAGHDIRMFIEDESVTLTVRAVVNKGGLAGRDPTLIVPLDRAQAIFGRADQINSIAVSNRGDETSGAKLLTAEGLSDWQPILGGLAILRQSSPRVCASNSSGRLTPETISSPTRISSAQPHPLPGSFRPRGTDPVHLCVVGSQALGIRAGAAPSRIVGGVQEG